MLLSFYSVVILLLEYVPGGSNLARHLRSIVRLPNWENLPDRSAYHLKPLSPGFGSSADFTLRLQRLL